MAVIDNEENIIILIFSRWFFKNWTINWIWFVSGSERVRPILETDDGNTMGRKDFDPAFFIKPFKMLRTVCLIQSDLGKSRERQNLREATNNWTLAKMHINWNTLSPSSVNQWTVYGQDVPFLDINITAKIHLEARNRPSFISTSEKSNAVLLYASKRCQNAWQDLIIIAHT